MSKSFEEQIVLKLRANVVHISDLWITEGCFGSDNLFATVMSSF